MFATVLILACGAEPQQFVVENKTVPAFTVTNRVANPDPYGITDYAYFHQLVVAGIRGVLVVGIEDRHVGTYAYHCRVPSGFGGLSDGEYDCFLFNGRPAMEKRGEVKPSVASPFRSGFHAGHDCPVCGRSQYVISGRGPVPGSHTHTCAAGHTWWH